VSVDGRLDVNVALNRPSFHGGGLYTESVHTYTSGYANDGNHNTTLFGGGYCMHTNSATNPWWAVDLGVALYVVGVKFTNRDSWGT